MGVRTEREGGQKGGRLKNRATSRQRWEGAREGDRHRQIAVEKEWDRQREGTLPPSTSPAPPVPGMYNK